MNERVHSLKLSENDEKLFGRKFDGLGELLNP
jgi:hypothetical protein